MIEPVSFRGKLHVGKTMSKLVDLEDKRFLNKIAKEDNCDIIIFGREEFNDGSKAYRSIVVKENKETGSNDIFSYMFGFKKK